MFLRTMDEGAVFLDFFVPGTPRPAGSKNAVPIFNRHTGRYVHDQRGRPVVNLIDSSDKLGGPWSALVSRLAMEAMTGPPLEGPLTLSCVFVMTRPKGHYRTGRNAHALRLDAPHWHTIDPDGLKLRRRIEDALTGIVWKDDNQVAFGCETKRYADPGETPGVQIRVGTLAANPNAWLTASLERANDARDELRLHHGEGEDDDMAGKRRSAEERLAIERQKVAKLEAQVSDRLKRAGSDEFRELENAYKALDKVRGRLDGHSGPVTLVLGALRRAMDETPMPAAATPELPYQDAAGDAQAPADDPASDWPLANRKGVA